MNYNNNRNSGRIVCCFDKKEGRQIGIYLASILFTLAWWIFIDGLAVLWILKDRKIAPGIEDWAPGITSTLGMIIVNIINKEDLTDNLYDRHVTLKARIFLFLGFAFMAGGFSGSVVVLITKYMYDETLDFNNTYLGITDVAQNSLIMISVAILWLAQSPDSQSYTSI